MKVVSTISNDKVVLLQTATIWAGGEQGGQLVQCLLDGGRQQTFVTTDAARRLHVKTVGKETLKIFGFSKVATAHERKLRQMEIMLRNPHDRRELHVEVLEAPSI